MIILDTNVLSELMRPVPTPEVFEWVARQPATRLFTTTITQAEILFGVASMPDGKRKRSLADAIDAIFEQDFRGRILPFDRAAARAYGPLAARRRAMGRPISQLDAQIAAIATCRGSCLATRNVADFDSCEIDLINPWP